MTALAEGSSQKEQGYRNEGEVRAFKKPEVASGRFLPVVECLLRWR